LFSVRLDAGLSWIIQM